ncbi:MAG TPA: hypothetical protein VK956_18455, partial [Verrucomicrobium sp.]|nr:hypothetical protein [Verrucomicrobium sp.]
MSFLIRVAKTAVAFAAGLFGGDIFGEQIAAGTDHVVALQLNGTVSTWGRNQSGQLGNNSFVASRVPVDVDGLGDVISVSAGALHSLALLSDGTVVAWGENGSGQLGNN